MNNPVEHARAALEGRIEVPAPTAICCVCEREILLSTARAIPAIGFMCPPNADPKCSPQRSIWDEVKDMQAYDRKVHVENVADLLVEFLEHAPRQIDPNDVIAEYAEKMYVAATDPTSYLPPRQPRKD